MPSLRSLAVPLLFAAASAGTIAGPRPLPGLCKPLLMPLLVVWFRPGWHGGTFGGLVVAALVASWLGDLALMGSGDGWFLAGVAAFLIAQLAYAAAFFGQARAAWPPPGIAVLCAAAVVAWGALFGASVVARVPGLLRGPVAVYATAISAMGVAAALRARGTSLASWALVFLGAELFIVSDSLLATDAFVAPLATARGAVMLTYCLGQFLIVAGCLRHLRDAGASGAGAAAE